MMTMFNRQRLADLPFVTKITTALFFIVFFSISPNYISIIYPEFKLVIVGLAGLFIFFLAFQARRVLKNSGAVYLFCFYLVVLVTAILNYLRLGNFEGLSFAISLFVKFSIIYLFLMSINEGYILKTLKILIAVMTLICIHSLLGELFYIIRIVSVTRNLEFQTYLYNIISIWGVFTISFNFNGLEIIRNQSFFQEPGFYAFYIFVAMIVLSLIRQVYSRRTFLIIYCLFFVTILSTLSVTGIILSAILTLLIFRNLIFGSITLFSSIIFLAYIMVSDNPYINKISSLAERIYGITNGLNIFSADAFTFLIGAGYESESIFSFDGKFNNFLLETILYSGVLNLLLLALFFYYIIKNCYGARFKYFLVLIFCATTPLFWSAIMIILNVVLLRYTSFKAIKLAENDK
ncbi:hypothetical protein VC623_15320 [Citrobacter amalonaticus]|uniref:hypothetical protein n=1 Tax=Citrobacter amalonaticus TaxID=35703 RepID=UPI00292AED67|nr:hypothetical protein [Citrobacter amalonaticus]MDV0785988.1 hypothetical protein [Citrobacter amalonaticus]MEB0642051.1 hypothetical protein [Citrobacter amalonaticus]